MRARTARGSLSAKGVITMTRAWARRATRLGGRLVTVVGLSLVAASFVAATARADPWQLEKAAQQAAAEQQADAVVPDALDRYVANLAGADAARLRDYESFRVTTPVSTAPVDTGGGFEVDWPSVGIGAGIALVAALLLVAGVQVAAHVDHFGRHGPIPH
jgi:hypothetical protein